MTLEQLLVVLDGRPQGQRALEHAIALAAALDARLHAVVVEGRLPAYATSVAEVDQAKKRKDEFFHTVARLAQEQAAEEGVELEIEVVSGLPVETILRIARRDRPDLIVVGYHGRLGGGIAARLCRRAPCPVLVVRGGSGQDASRALS